ncbi:MAG: tetratricopeptide repeat protein [Deferribacterales bacterium]
MRNIFTLILIILTVALAVSYSVNFYTGKKPTELPVQLNKAAQPETPAFQMPDSGVNLVPEEPDMANTDVYTSVVALEKSIGKKLSIIARSSNNKEVIARIDQLSKQLENDVTLVLAAVNKKEQWYRNEFYQVLIGLLAVFVLFTVIMIMGYVSIKKFVAQSLMISGFKPVQTSVDDAENPILTAVGAVAAKLAVKIGENRYLFDADKAVRLTSVQKNVLSEITDEILFLDKAGSKLSPEELYLLGVERLNEKNYTEANTLFEHIRKDDSDFAAAWYMTGYIAYLNKKYDLAAENLAKACMIEPENDTFQSTYGSTCLKLRRYSEAASALEKAASIKPDDAAVWNNLAHAYIVSGETEKAAEAFQKAADLKPDFHEALHNLGLALGRLNKQEEALAAFEKAIAAKPDKHESMYNAACLYAILGKREGALKNLKKAIELSPDYAKKARTDKDFESFANDAEFKAIAG